MAKPPPEIYPPEQDAAYNNPELDPREFLLAVMRDRRLPMQARIQAAKDVSVYVHPRLAQVSQEMTGGLTIKIEGGLPALPGTNIIMPKHGPAPKPNGHDTPPVLSAAPTDDEEG